MRTIVEPEDALSEARRAHHDDRPDEEEYYLGYATGLMEAYRGVRRDPALQVSKKVYAHGYRLAYDQIVQRGEVGSRALTRMGRPMPRAPVFANARRTRRSRRSRSRRSRRANRRGA